MPQFSVRDAKTQLSKLIAQALAGEDVVITRRNVPVVHVTPLAPRGKRRFGASKENVAIDNSLDGEAYCTVKDEVAESERLLQLIDRSGDEPMVKGTRVSAYRLAALANGMTVEEIARDYPGLDERQVQAAVTFAENHPDKGRLYPQASAKKAMRDAGVKDADQFLPARG